MYGQGDDDLIELQFGAAAEEGLIDLFPVDAGLLVALPGVHGEELSPPAVVAERSPIARAERPMCVPSSTTTAGL